MDELEARRVPRSVAVCPICDSDLWIEEISSATEDDEGNWFAEDVHLTCVDEPDMDHNIQEWHEWNNWHFSTPYIDWLPVRETVEEWMRKPAQKERFEVIWNDSARLPDADG
ncbi:MAG: hypothetical protein NW224_05790 [Leptolyngbyaceae cyanobacterium bins.302]|nr:hypothetical protein [Leptolyngbyaceae cyanobacterium bins.302]